MADGQTAMLLRLDGIAKSFGATRALDGVHFDLKAGEVHALCGENGAGKSTLIKVLSGAHMPDTGVLTIGDQSFSGLTPELALNHGIATIYQENSLFLNLSVAENIYVGRELLSTPLTVDRRATTAGARKILDVLKADIDPGTLVSRLSGAQQKIVEIARAFRQQARVLVMDEPSASFGRRETELLFDAVRSAVTSGTGVIYISHHLEEVFELSDRVTVLRDGRNVATHQVSEIGQNDLIRDMVGREVDDIYHRSATHRGDARGTVLEVEALSAPGITNVGLSVRQGEIVGLAGLVGAGRSELLNAIFGSNRSTSGQLRFGGKSVRITSPQAAIATGMCLITEDRKTNGLFLRQSYVDNFVIPFLSKFKRWIVNWSSAESDARSYAKSLSIRLSDIHQVVANLSGGNQQKAIIAKWLRTEPDLFLLDEPTRGIDMGSREEIYVEIQSLVKRGKSILMASSDLPELIGLCDRVLVMKSGKVICELIGGDITEHRILAAAL
ncbi:MAG: sugar ABC transporter ATP-binding protein [Hyphomicrobiales bacterium]|nr:sugar ABC transporter ATP-binding protein [Hyphomicrobiales bacterium]